MQIRVLAFQLQSDPLTHLQQPGVETRGNGDIRAEAVPIDVHPGGKHRVEPKNRGRPLERVDLGDLRRDDQPGLLEEVLVGKGIRRLQNKWDNPSFVISPDCKRTKWSVL